ncbi:histidine triad protein [Nostoc sp. NIES-3756]|uniref:HIT family protein n=1 Tax=Nostoc sp. NIES-3756 TaxID=1751286 RepID=UPI000720590D|nr:HIT domain-containing protein [Nostoc sp. NIES-3756]BAT51367.1 histidine triad protein [Nostoc sp. NIES-3756]
MMKIGESFSDFIKRNLFKIARSSYSAYFIGMAFEYLSFLMPLDKVYETNDNIAFKHAVPFWSIHFLVVPKRKVLAFKDLNLQCYQDIKLITEIFKSAKIVINQQSLFDCTILVNGGEYQDVPQIHFHLASGIQKDGTPMYREKFAFPSQDSDCRKLGQAIAYFHPYSVRAFHYIITAVDNTLSLFNLDLDNELHRATLLDVLRLCQKLIIDQSLTKYTVLANTVAEAPEPKLTFHLVAD